MSFFVMNLICCMIYLFIFFFLVQLLVFIAVTAFNKRGPHGRLVFTKCVLPSVNKVYYYYYYYNYYLFHTKTVYDRNIFFMR